MKDTNEMKPTPIPPIMIIISIIFTIINIAFSIFIWREFGLIFGVLSFVGLSAIWFFSLVIIAGERMITKGPRDGPIE